MATETHKVESRKLTERDIKYLITYYPVMGPEKVAKKLGVSRTTVTVYGRLYGVDSYTPPDGHLAIREVAIDAGVTHQAVWRKAKAAGVLHTRGKRGNKARSASVPAWWAEEYKKSRPEHIDEELRGAGWMTTNEFAEYMNFGQVESRKYLRSLHNSRSGGTEKICYLATYFADARIRRARAEGVGGYKYMIYGADVEAGRSRLEHDRHEASKMRTLDELAQMAGISRHAMLSRVRYRGVTGRLLPDKNYRKALHISLEDAEEAGLLK